MHMYDCPVPTACWALQNKYDRRNTRQIIKMDIGFNSWPLFILDLLPSGGPEREDSCLFWSEADHYVAVAAGLGLGLGQATFLTTPRSLQSLRGGVQISNQKIQSLPSLHPCNMLFVLCSPLVSMVAAGRVNLFADH